jgi:predicted Fe-Mo cluster-binding NifX family protein
MRICIPTAGMSGLADTVYGHFGSAPYFTVIDTATGGIELIDNSRKQHEHGSCAPSEELVARGIDAVACGGMGRRALATLTDAGIRVFLTQAVTPHEAVGHVTSGAAEVCTPEAACAGHSHHHHHH